MLFKKNFRKKKKREREIRPLKPPHPNYKPHRRKKRTPLTIGIVTSRNRDNLSSFTPPPPSSRPIKSSSRTPRAIPHGRGGGREGITRISSRVVEHGSTGFPFFRFIVKKLGPSLAILHTMISSRA